MWKKYLASLATVSILTPILCGAFYLQQNYSAKISDKVATAAAMTFKRNNTHSLINQVSPFQKMPVQNIQNNTVPTGNVTAPPLRPYVPIPSSPSSSDPVMPQMPYERDLPNIKSVIFSADSNNIAILADAQKDIMVEVGQATKWGNVEEISAEGVYIDGKLYKAKTM